MILLWLIVAVMTVVVLVLLVWPLLRDDSEAPPDRATYDLTVYRDQLAEIDRDVTRGLLSPEQADAARLEIQRRMLAVSGAETGTRGDVAGFAAKVAVAASRRPVASLGEAVDVVRGALRRAWAQGPWGLATLAGIGAVLPVGALAIYLILGSPGLPAQPHAERIAREEQRLMASLPPVLRETIANLSADVEADPENARLWMRLGRAHRAAEQHDKAVDALENARTLSAAGGMAIGERGTLLADLAESLIMTHDGLITDRIRALFLETLAVTPGDPRARFYMGMAAIQAGEPVTALAIWRDLADTSAPEDSWMPMLRQNMGMVAQEHGIVPASVEPLHPLRIEAGETVTRRDVPAPESAPGAAAGDRLRTEADAAREPGQGFSVEEQAMIKGMVEGLAARLDDNPDDAEGWQQLARSYRVLGRLDESAEAMGRAAALRPDDVAVLSAQAEALIAAARSRGAKEPPDAVYAVYAAILEHQPDNPNALYFVGRAAAESGDAGRARDLWSRLLERIPPDEPAHASLRQQLEALPASDAPAEPEGATADP